MYDKEALDRKLETTTWGLLFVFWGISIFFDAIPFGVGLAGTGLILLGLNGVRAVQGIRTRGATSVCGILALIWGALELIRAYVHLPFELNDWAVFSILLVVFGLMLLGAALRAGGRPKANDPRSEA